MWPHKWRSKNRKPPPLTRGVKVLHTCEDAIVDICFVHGLTGDRETTWTVAGQQLPWPQTLLPPQLPKARILTFGYDAYAARVGPASTNGVADHAANLVNDLVGNRESCNATSHGLIFVAHSLGGLVCKSALDFSRGNQGKHLRNVFDKVIGIVFFGTPHRGSWMAAWAKIPVSSLGVWQSGNTKLIDVLRTKSEMLESIRENFSRMIHGLKEDGRDIKVTCFYEEMPLPVVGQVVPKESATLESSLNFPIHQDHRNMVRFESAESDDFLKLLNELRRWTNSIDQKKLAADASLSPGTQSQPAKNRHEPPRLVPLDRNGNFTGRVQDLKRLRETAAPKQQATTRVAISGLGGIGKTQLALEYVYQQGREDPDCAVFWISCMSRETIDQGYLGAVHALGDDGLVENMDKADDLALEKALRDRLSRKDSGRWILVFDNVDDISFWEDSKNKAQGVRGLIDCLPRSELGTIIFTTRDQNIAVRLARQNIVKLSEMDQVDSRQLLQNLLIDKTLVEPGTNEDIERLLSSLLCLPLALSQAAYYINRNGITISDYLGLFDAQEEQTIELLGRDFEDGQQVRHPVATTWLISFKRIKTENPLATDYISFMACTDFKDIPDLLLPPAPSPLARTEAIGILKAYSFISKHRSQGGLLSMHRLVHLAARNWLRIENALDFWTDRVIGRLNETLDDPYSYLPAQWRPIMPHASYVLSQRAGPCPFRSPSFHLLSNYARCLHRIGRYHEAERYLVRFLDICNTQGEAKHPQTASESDRSQLMRAQKDLIKVYTELGRADEAAQYGEEALREAKENLGDDHPNTLATTSDLVAVYYKLGRLDKAVESGEEALQKEKKILGDDHPNTLATMHNLSMVYFKQGRLDKAAKVGEEALQKEKKILGDDHPNTLAMIHNLLMVYHDQGELDKAATLGEEVLQRRRKILEDDHPDTLITMHNLATVYHNLGRLDKAAKFGEETLQKRKEILGDDHPHTIASMHGLGITMMAKGQRAYALELMEGCVEASKRCFGPKNATTVDRATLLATWKSQGGR